MELFTTPPNSPILAALIIVYFLLAAVTTFEIRVIQSQKSKVQQAGQVSLPAWTGIFAYLMWLAWLAIFLLNWQLALVVFVLKFILKVLPVLEIFGSFILTPIKRTQLGTNDGESSDESRNRLIENLESIKNGKTSPEAKQRFSSKLIKASPLSEEEKLQLLERLESDYKR